MKDYHVAFDKESICLEIISFIILFLTKHGEGTTGTHSSPASEDEHVDYNNAINNHMLYNNVYDNVIHNDNIIYNIYDNVIYNNNIIYNDVDGLDMAFGSDQMRPIGPMDGG